MSALHPQEEPASLLTIEEVAALLRRSVPTVRRRVHAGDLTAFRLTNGGPWLFRKDDVLNRLTPVEVSSSSSTPTPKVRTPPTEVDWLAGLTGVTSPKVNHGS
jgi:excisionase family DNA binding protein